MRFAQMLAAAQVGYLAVDQVVEAPIGDQARFVSVSAPRHGGWPQQGRQSQ